MPEIGGLSAKPPNFARIWQPSERQNHGELGQTLVPFYHYSPGATATGSPGRQMLYRQYFSKALCFHAASCLSLQKLPKWLNQIPEKVSQAHRTADECYGGSTIIFLLLCLHAEELQRCFGGEEHDPSEGEACRSSRWWVSTLASPPRLHLGML